MSAPEHFLWKLDGSVGVITLNRPERKNPLTFESYAELRDFFGELTSDKAGKAGGPWEISVAPFDDFAYYFIA